MSLTLRKLLCAALGTLAFAATTHAADKLVIAATPVPHAELLESNETYREIVQSQLGVDA